MQSTRQKHRAQDAERPGSRMSFTSVNGIARTHVIAKLAKSNVRMKCYGSAHDACSGWKSNSFHRIKCSAKMRGGAESASTRDLRKNNVMRQMGASNSKLSLLSEPRNGIPRTNAYVDIGRMAKNLANGGITIVCNVVIRSPKMLSKILRES